MARKCLLFAYGLLQPGHAPPRSVTNHWPDRVRGVLYDLGAFPAALQLGTAATWIPGVTMEIDADELPAIDEFEDTESGEFVRILVETEGGHMAWAYEYRMPVPKVLLPVERWRK